MARWEPRVRAHIVDFELVSSLQFDDGAKTLRTTKTNGDGSIVTLSRPDPAYILANQMQHVRSYADLRRDRHQEILAQLSNLADFFGGICYLHPQRTRFTIELIAVFMRALVSAEMRVKHALASPRPVDYSPQVLPMIQTPGHSCFPSGHATEGFMLAQVLAEIMKGEGTEGVPAHGRPDPQADWRELFMRLAARIAVNRIVAGVHFPVDNAAGMVTGVLLGKYFVALAKRQAGPLRTWTFTADRYGQEDFRWRDMLQQLDNPAGGELSAPGVQGAFLKSGPTFELTPVPEKSPLPWLWNKAVEEWKKLN
jgi:membrane-associated phospholipid phosphatase